MYKTAQDEVIIVEIREMCYRKSTCTRSPLDNFCKNDLGVFCEHRFFCHLQKSRCSFMEEMIERPKDNCAALSLSDTCSCFKTHCTDLGWLLHNSPNPLEHSWLKRQCSTYSIWPLYLRGSCQLLKNKEPNCAKDYESTSQIYFLKVWSTEVN